MAQNLPLRGIVMVLLVILAMPATTGVGVAASSTPSLPSIGLSGSFYTLTGLEVPAGGVVSSRDVYVVVYSYGSKPVRVRLTYSAPEGLTVVFNSNTTVFTLQPGEHRVVPVVITVDKHARPGSYPVVIMAQQVVENETGIHVVAAVSQKAVLRVTGEYAVINAVARDPSGRLVSDALIRLVGYLNGRPISIMDSYGRLHAVVVPGNYTLEAYLHGFLVAEENLTVRNGTVVNKDLYLRIIFIEYFSVKPVLSEKNRLVAARIHVIINNVYKTVNNITVKLYVWRNGKLLETRDLVAQSTLPLGRSDYKFDYVPKGGWKPGNYTFQVRVYGFNGKLLAESNTTWLNYQPHGLEALIASGWQKLLILVIIISIIIISYELSRRKGKKAKHKSERYQRAG